MYVHTLQYDHPNSKPTPTKAPSYTHLSKTKCNQTAVLVRFFTKQLPVSMIRQADSSIPLKTFLLKEYNDKFAK